MKKLLLALIIAGSFFSGCATLVETPKERDRRILTGWNLDLRMAVEDWDYFWLVDRNSYLTQWHPRTGI